MLRKHWHNPVYKIDARCTVARLTVKCCIGLHIMCDIGNVHPYFIVPVRQASYRKSIVEIFCITRVYRKGHGVSHIFPCRYHFWRYSGINFLRGFLHSFGIAVWQTEFGQNGMLFCCVFTGYTKNIDNLTLRILCLVGPIGNPHYCLVAVFSAFELSSRNIDICSQIL